jgi:hypothetical protein
VPRGQRDGSPRPYSRFSRQEPLIFYQVAPQLDRLCGLVARVLDYRGPRVRFPGTTKKGIVGLERGPLSLVSTTEELLDRKVAAPV